MSQRRRARQHARSALRPACERLEGRALLSRAPAALLPPQVEVFMGAPSAFVFQQSGSAQITLTRPPPSAQGTLSVEFSTDSAASPESVPAKTIAAATPGQQYLPVDETVTFQPGQTALTVSVPIVPNAANPGIVLVEMTANPLVTGGIAATGYFAIVSGPHQLPLTINSAQIVPQASGASAIALTFNEPLAQASAESIQNYMITHAPAVPVVPPHTSGSSKPASPHGSALQNSPLGGIAAGAALVGLATLAAVGARYKIPRVPPIPLQSATYDAATNTVTLVTTKPLNPARVYQVAIGSGVGTPARRKHNPSNGGDLIDQGGGSLTWSSPPQPPGVNLVDLSPGGNLVDLSRNIISYFTASPTSFNVSSRPSAPPRLAPYSPPRSGSYKYTFS